MYIRLVKGHKCWLAIFLLYLLQTQVLPAQLQLINPPKENAFLSRNISTNKASMVLSGRITDPAYTSLQINIYKNHSLLSSNSYTINFAQNLTGFSQTTSLTAGKYIYTLEFKLSGSASYSKTIDGIMVGDAYLVQGQSNAVAGNYVNTNINFSLAYNDTFIKSFGSLYNVYDTAWYKADGEKYYSQGSVGQWELVLAKSLLDSFGIPICIINGAIGGTQIWQHVRTPGNSTDFNSIYGLLLYRVRKAQLANFIRGIFYFQGESDGSNANLHDSLFKEIYGCWNQDYKGFKKLYVVQVRGKGCGLPSIQLREYQRQFGFSLSKCTVISSNGLNGHDGCHYSFSNGYELLGKQIAALVSRDLYQGKTTTNIDPPNIKNCFYSNAAQNEITINMQNAIDLIYTDNLFHKLFRIEGDTSVKVINGFIRKNKVVIQLSKSSCEISGLTYDSDVGTQPWVKNALKMGLISFYNVPILRHQIASYYSGCKKAMITMGEDSIPGCKYLWKRPATKQNYTTARLKIRGDSVEALTLVITYGINACITKDTLIVYLSPDPVTIPELGADRTICKYDSIIFRPDYFGFSQFKWSSSKPISYQSFYKSSNSEKIVLTATSQKQCIYKDSVSIYISDPQVKLPDGIVICPHTDTMISIANNYNSYQWNNRAGINQYKSGPGILIVEVSNNIGCKGWDTAVIKSFKETPKPILFEYICGNEFRTIKQPCGFKSWEYQSSKIVNGLTAYPDKFYPVSLIDSNDCKVDDTLQTIGMAVPEFSMGSDTGFCLGSSLTIHLPENMSEYFWNNLQSSNATVNVAKTGQYIARIRNNNQCQFSDTIIISSYELPDISNFRDTVLCTGSFWQPVFSSKIQYTINSSTIPSNFAFRKAGFYAINATNEFQCSREKTILISFKDCNNTSVRNFEKDFINLYPNPTGSVLNISVHTDIETLANLYSVEGKLLFSVQLLNGLNVIDLSDFATGSYYIAINEKRFRIVKM